MFKNVQVCGCVIERENQWVSEKETELNMYADIFTLIQPSMHLDNF